MTAQAESQTATQTQTQAPACVDCGWTTQEMDLFLDATYYNIRKFRASLILNNKGPDPLPVELTFHSLEGERLEKGTIELEGNSAQVVDLNALLAEEENRFREGNLRLRYRYDGCSLVLSAGVILEDPAVGISFDELMSRPHLRSSTTLESVWWVPRPSARMEVAVTNMSDNPRTASLEIQSEGSPGRKQATDIHLDPHETRLVNVARVFSLSTLGAGQWQAGSVTLRADGEPGEVIARGMIEERASGFSTVIEFNDPASSRGRELHGTGLRLRDGMGQPLLPVVVVRNLAEVENEVTITITYRDADSTAGTLTLEPVRLEPGEVRNLAPEVWERLATLSDREVLSAGYEARTPGESGSVLVSALSVSASGREVYRVPMIDPRTKGSAGNYPWKLDPMTSTVVSLKNVTAETQKYTVQIDFEGGAYVLGLKELEAGQSVAIDLRRIRDRQELDEQGNVIPLEAAAGQVHWSVIGTDNHSMVGRAEYVDEAHGLASTFACSNCCPDSFNGAWISPHSSQIPVSGHDSLTSFEGRVNCYGSVLQPYEVNGYWHSDNPFVAPIDPNGRTTGTNTGTAEITANWNACVWYYQSYPAGACVSNCFQVGPTNAHSVWAFDLDVEYAKDESSQGGWVLLESGLWADKTKISSTLTGISESYVSYSWSTGPGLSAVSGLNSSLIEVKGTQPSVIQDDSFVELTVTGPGGKEMTASVGMTIREPRFLKVRGAVVTIPQMDQNGVYLGYVTSVYYFASDQLPGDNIIVLSGAPWGELLSTVSNPFEAEFDPPSGEVKIEFMDSSGACFDELTVVAPGGLPEKFEAVRTQTLYVGGFAFPGQSQTYGYTAATLGTTELIRW